MRRRQNAAACCAAAARARARASGRCSKAANTRPAPLPRPQESAEIARHQAAVKQVVAAAETEADPLRHFAPFARFNRNGLDATIAAFSAATLPPPLADWTLALCRGNMQQLYEGVWGWSDKKKQRQLAEVRAAPGGAHGTRMGPAWPCTGRAWPLLRLAWERACRRAAVCGSWVLLARQPRAVGHPLARCSYLLPRLAQTLSACMHADPLQESSRFLVATHKPVTCNTLPHLTNA